MIGSQAINPVNANSGSEILKKHLALREKIIAFIQDDLTAEQFFQGLYPADLKQAVPDEGPEKGKTGWWELVYALGGRKTVEAEEHEERITCFLIILNKWMDQLTVNDLQQTANGKSVSQLLLENDGGRVDEFELDKKSIIGALLMHSTVPGIEDEFVMDDPEYPDEPLTMNFLEAIFEEPWNAIFMAENRSEFFKAVAEFNHGNVDQERLEKLALDAQERGFVNAFLVLGQVYQKKRLIDEACEAYARVPKESLHINNVKGWLAELWYNQALHTVSTTSRAIYLGKALEYALQCTNKEDAKKNIQKIAFTFIHPGEMPDPLSNILSEEEVEEMLKRKTFKWCVQKLETVKARMAFENLPQNLHLMFTPATPAPLLFGSMAGAVSTTEPAQAAAACSSSSESQPHKRHKPRDN